MVLKDLKVYKGEGKKTQSLEEFFLWYWVIRKPNNGRFSNMVNVFDN